MRIYFLLILLSVWACDRSAGIQISSQPKAGLTELPTYEIPAIETAEEDLVLNRSTGSWSLHGIPYSGYSIKRFPDGKLEKKTGFYQGKKQGKSWAYYPDGHLKHITPYHKNLVHGRVHNWFGNQGHPPLAIRNYYLGKPHGSYKKWYKSGQLFKQMNYDLGKEVGMQKAYNENGSLYANYEARNGRSFGLKRAMLCYRLEDEKISYYEGN